MKTNQRTGARSIKDIPDDILSQINTGQIQTANLVEWLAIDQKILLKTVLKQHHRPHYIKPIITAINQLSKQTTIKLTQVIGTQIHQLTIHNNDLELITILANHPADLVRCWATYTIASDTSLTIKQLLNLIQPYAADQHFGVREISWMALRPIIEQHLEHSINILSKWTLDQDPNIRRFATESTRPRGVWCKHINKLKQQPELALPILEPLKADQSKYVQNSLANWLNDASKTQPEFVIELCKLWNTQSNSNATKYIINKAMRTISK